MKRITSLICLILIELCMNSVVCGNILKSSKRAISCILASGLTSFNTLVPSYSTAIAATTATTATTVSSSSSVTTEEKKAPVKGLTQVDGEVARVFRKAIQCESDGNLIEAQQYLQQVVEVEPNYIYGWSNLGNVLVSRGYLDDALLCYKKAIVLSPPKDQLSVILLNKASLELSKGEDALALKDLEYAERLSGTTSEILTNKAVALTNAGKWTDASEIFEKVISSADRNALPWWLRYSETLLEIGRPMEAVAYLQRTLNRFPDELECKAFAVALYTSLDTKVEAQRYWVKMSDDEKAMYRDETMVTSKLKWGATAVAAFKDFLRSKYAI